MPAPIGEHCRAVVQFPVRVDVFDWFFNGRTGYRAHFRAALSALRPDEGSGHVPLARDRCLSPAVCGDRRAHLPALEAAHIQAHASDGPDRIDNGLLLRADVHRLFDDGYVTLDDDSRFVVSPRVRDEFENGREYYRYHGSRLASLPELAAERPSREFIDWHYENTSVE